MSEFGESILKMTIRTSLTVHEPEEQVEIAASMQSGRFERAVFEDSFSHRSSAVLVGISSKLEYYYDKYFREYSGE